MSNRSERRSLARREARGDGLPYSVRPLGYWATHGHDCYDFYECLESGLLKSFYACKKCGRYHISLKSQGLESD